MIIKGSVEKFLYRNPENGYCVVIVGDANFSTTAVGILPPCTEGETLELDGEYIVNPKYGEQFAIKSAKICLPTALDNIAKYLASGLFKGVGEVTADIIVDKFGADTFDVIENRPMELSKIKGITAKKAMTINETFVQLKDMQDTILELQKLEISLNLALKIYKVYGKATLSKINENPYKLIEDVDGIGFITADKIAHSMNIAKDSEFRVRAGIIYLLRTVALASGHTYLPKDKLFKDLQKLLDLHSEQTEELFAGSILSLEVSGKIVVIEKSDEIAVMFNSHYLTERKIATNLIRINNAASDILTDIERDIEEFEFFNDIKMHDNQKAAVINAIQNGVNIITGGPGTGKTTIIKCILTILKKLNLKVQLCAPTGRASKRLSEATGEDAKTIHRLLDLDFKNGKGYFTYNEHTRLESDVIIIDEVSMCDEYVFDALISAIQYGSRLIMVGDKDQLPSVGAGNVLADIIGFGKIKISELTYIYRQSQESLIIENAHRINDGLMPIIRNQNSDFLFDETDSSIKIADKIVEMVSKRIPDYLGVESKEIQVLCPLKKGDAGVIRLNSLLQNAINPSSFDKAEIKYSEMVFRLGDKVIHIMNNYDLEWTKGNEEEGIYNGVGVFNGDIGHIIEVNTEENTLTVEFDDDRVAVYTRDLFEQIVLAYAISVHKSQGSEFDVVVIALMGGSYTLMTRNLLYTAVTRAKKMSVIVGSKKHLENMVKNNYTAKRYTLLKEFLIEEYNRQCLRA